MSWRTLLAVILGAAGLLFWGLPAVQAADFDTSALPKPPTTFEEQKLWDAIETARQYPDLAPDTHRKLADYYERRGLTALAAKERAAAGGGAAAPAAPAPAAVPAPAAPAPQPAAEPAPLESADSPEAPGAAAPESAAPEGGVEADLDPAVFDLSAFPATPSNFEEQLIREFLDDPNTLTTPALLALAHRKLGTYYAAMGRVDLSATEYARAVIAYPEDPRSYIGLAALSEAVGSEAGDGNVALRDVAQRLQEQGYAPEGEAEPEPAVVSAGDRGQGQEVSAEFNRRMNYLYTSNAWSNVYRTTFTNLYGR